MYSSCLTLLNLSASIAADAKALFYFFGAEVHRGAGHGT